MAKRKSLEQMSADELYELAREREEEEQARQEAERREQIEALMERRRELLARHKSEVAVLDKEIRALGGRSKGRRRRRAGGNLSQHVVDAIATSGQISTRDLKDQLNAQGVDTRNISQTLAYLKRTGRIVSQGRGVYTAA